LPEESPEVLLDHLDPEEQVERLLRDLRTSRQGLSTREAARRLEQFGTNELRRRRGLRWPGELARQLTHPLALLLWVAAALSFAVGTTTVGVAVIAIILLNAAFAFIEEQQAERAVQALAQYLPQQVTVLRDGTRHSFDAAGLVPGDVVILEEGERIPADVRLLEGAIELDMSTLTGESVPALRAARLLDTHVPLLAARDLVLSGTSCTGGEARGVVFATGMATELGRIATLSERVTQEPSPLERQVRRVAWLIAGVAVVMALGFLPLATLAAGLSIRNAVVFAVGLLAGNVPEGLLPVITLALALAVRSLARQGAVVKRLSAVETLGSTDVICTDKTGTLTENRMQPTAVLTVESAVDIVGGAVSDDVTSEHRPDLEILAEVGAACNNSRLDPPDHPSGDPTEIAVLVAARALGGDVDPDRREERRRWHYHFDPQLKLMSVVVSPRGQQEAADGHDEALVVETKGAPEAVLPRCSGWVGRDGSAMDLDKARRERISNQVETLAGRGLRVLALARRELPPGTSPPHRRDEAERDLCFVGLISMLDPPRPEVAGAVSRCHTAGIRVIVITGDHPLTASAIAAQVGIGAPTPTVMTGERLDALTDDQLDELLRTQRELVFARTSPEAKLCIAEALRAEGHVVAMTGDGVNDAPALRRSDIGVAMGRSGTDVAREASTMVLTDDHFATITEAVRAGRRVYDNVRKFVIYIFAHATPEVVPFLVFALAGGAVPLPLTVLQLLAFDVGTETLPALALGTEPAEPGIMERPPRPRSEGVIRPAMLVRAWLFLGLIVAALQMAGFFYVLTKGGWTPGAPTGPGHPLHHVYKQATTMSFLGMIVGQIGTAFAVRTERASLRSVGVFSNRNLIWAILAGLLLAALFIYAPPFQDLLGTAGLPPSDLAIVLPYPFIVWGADELRRYLVRRHEAGRHRRREK
jgi:calcium-translocating P-type ATPase